MASIQGVYLALFARPADPAGLAYFNSVTGNGADLSAIGDLAGTQEYRDRFAGQSNTAIVSSIYQSLFNRQAEAAGVNFFVDQLNRGALTIKNIAIAILDGAQGDDKLVASNKLAAADSFTKAIDTSNEVRAYAGNDAAAAGRGFLTGVTKDAATIPNGAAADKILAGLVAALPVSSGGPGVNIALTTGDDVVSPNAKDAAMKSTAGDDTITANATGAGFVTTTTLSSTDKIDGGDGYDTLVFKAVAGARGGDGIRLIDLKPTITSVEKISVTETKTPSGDDVNVDFNLANSIGYKEIWNVDTHTNFGGNSYLSFGNINIKTIIGLNKASDETYFYFKDSSGFNDSITMKLVDALAWRLHIDNNIEILNMDLSGVNKIFYLAANFSSLRITGTGDLSWDPNPASVLATVDASAGSGNLTMSLNNRGVTYIGSQGIDTVTLGASRDIVVYSPGNISTVNKVDTIKAFTATAGPTKDRIDVSAFALKGDKSSLVTFTNAPISGADTFNGKAAALFVDSSKTTWVYFDTNGNNVFDAGTDLAVSIEAVGGNAVGFTKDNIIF
ncbi:DUF4214 domain-containing protein [Rhizobium oryzicola]|uniref:DUF4214 domain-containing protein n=1 Tax=Rhizobium oryzicola TaxID=1232668 RepID=A0ABT8SYA7_9HYPH|nr:DUF4214 domain-containing protein [Rhizobium oryzicola]MDO1583393.1 DUF4214 domain-containing protein [Rhizobium oryzicola]